METTETKVLVLEDESSIRSFVRINLKRGGFQVIEAETGEEALDIVKRETDIRIALLDVMLPTSCSGFDVCRELRKLYPHIGIIMLTAKGQDHDKVEGFESGADDYVTKPFSPVELVARVQALLRRMGSVSTSQETDHDEQRSGPFCISMDTRKFYKNNVLIELTPTEFSIMKLFMDSPNKSISRDDILNEVWGRHYMGDLKIVDVNIRRIRQKIEDQPSQPQYIETVWGFGYLWKKE
ncbi:response regulator transcription factor [Paenibacillus sp. N1-5-1-14]|uniref:response regulator transcription factor n=1 Tax=Paenibacillus radicibacter TaxID=2972488 RepID=UPI0021590FE2|nr:response regulator transcription factor [Paenibacillus radicibacter]MCR8645675.1 response regulator transcription factor [Paenibacillus radicibacter]